MAQPFKQATKQAKSLLAALKREIADADPGSDLAERGFGSTPSEIVQCRSLPRGWVGGTVVELGSKERGQRTVLISGASGFVGRCLSAHLADHDWSVRSLVRHEPTAEHEVQWDPVAETMAAGALTGVDAVVHLAGESVNGRWSETKKARILKSRVAGTRTLAVAIARAAVAPKVFVSASAVGYYGDRGAETLTEDSTPGGDFLAMVCQAWEREAQAVSQVCRVVNPRIGIVFGPDGGALKEMAAPFRYGLGGKLGSGDQFVSWISLLDLVRLIEFALVHEQLQGPVNAVAPSPVTNATLTQELGRCLHRPTLFRVPAFALRLGLGEFATEVLSSKRVIPRVAVGAGFCWQHRELQAALDWALQG